MPKVNEDNSIYIFTREEWRKWLQENYHTASEIWVVYPRKHSGKPRIPYSDRLHVEGSTLQRVTKPKVSYV